MPRKDLLLSEKIKLLDKIKNLPSNTSQRKISESIKVPQSTISRLLQEEKKIREDWSLLQDSKKRNHKRDRGGKDPDVEEALFQWFSVVSKEGLPLNGEILKTKSEELAKMLGHVNFKATDGWLSRWKTRHSIKCRKKKKKTMTLITKKNKSIQTTNDLGSDSNISKRVTLDEAEKCINQLRLYFIQEGIEESPYAALDSISNFIYLQSIKSDKITYRSQSIRNMVYTYMSIE